MRASRKKNEEFTIEYLAEMNEKLRDQLHRKEIFWKAFAVTATIAVGFVFYWTMKTTEFRSRPAIHEINRIQAELDKTKIESTKNKRDRDLLFHGITRFVDLKVKAYEKQSRPISEAGTLQLLVNDVNDVTDGIEELPRIIFFRQVAENK